MRFINSSNKKNEFKFELIFLLVNFSRINCAT